MLAAEPTVQWRSYDPRMPWSVRSAVAVLVLASAALLTPFASAFQGQQVYVLGDCLHAQIRPSEIVFACADANAYATNAHYLTYGGKVAVARVTWHENDCIPNCAQGHFVSTRATVTFYAVARCGRKFFYTETHISSKPGNPWAIGPTKHCGRVLG